MLPQPFPVRSMVDLWLVQCGTFLAHKKSITGKAAACLVRLSKLHEMVFGVFGKVQVSPFTAFDGSNKLGRK